MNDVKAPSFWTRPLPAFVAIPTGAILLLGMTLMVYFSKRSLPEAAGFVTMFLAVMGMPLAIAKILERLRVSWWLRYRRWTQTAPPQQTAWLVPAQFIYWGVAGAVIVIPLARLHLISVASAGMLGSSIGWLIWGAWMAFAWPFFGAIFNSIFKPNEEPEDWLTWDLKARPHGK